MENEKQIVVVNTTDKMAIIDESFSSLEKMEAFCQRILESKLAPDHFYPKLPGTNDRDYKNGNVSAVMMVLIQGRQLNLPVLTALQHIVPVNGLLSIKGDAAKSMILGSGKIKPGSWSETEEGTIEAGDYKTSITATRSDTGETMTRSFSIMNAKKAGLWITPEMVNGQDGWRWKKSAWYKFPERMIKYRALGFLARDLFPDVMSGIYTTEEAVDILPQETTTIINTETGKDIIIPDKTFVQERSHNLTQRAIDKISEKHNFQNYPATSKESFFKKAEHDVVGAQEVKEVSKSNSGQIEGNFTMLSSDSISVQQGAYSSEELDVMPTMEILDICLAIPELSNAVSVIPGKNTKKKLKGIIIAAQEGHLDTYILSKQKEAREELEPKEEPEQVMPVEFTEIPEGTDMEEDKIGVGVEDLESGDDQGQTDPIISSFDLPFDVSTLKEGEVREFADAAALYQKLKNLPIPITEKRYTELVFGKLEFRQFPTKEVFCKLAGPFEFDYLLKSNNK